MIKLRVWMDIDVPEGATHYFGDLCDDPTWVKDRFDALGGRMWFIYKRLSEERPFDWYLSHHGDEVPAWSKPLRDITL